jgi:hypothetical protein
VRLEAREQAYLPRQPFGGIISVQEGSRMLFESEDSEDNADKTLKELGFPLALASNQSLDQFSEGDILDDAHGNVHCPADSEDSEDNADKTLKELGIGVGKFVTISDDDEPHWPS